MQIRNFHLILNDGKADSRLLREASAIVELLGSDEGVEILAASRAPGMPIELLPKIRLTQIELIPGQGRAARFKTALRLFRWYLKVLCHLWPHGAVTLNVHHAELLPLALLVRFLKGSAIIYVPHELEAERAGQRRSKSRLIARIERFAWPKLAGVAVVNESIADEYLLRYGNPRPSVIENVQATSIFAGEPKDLRLLTGLSSERRICIYVGALVPNRGIEPLLEWFSTSLQNEFALVCMGSGELAAVIEAAAAGSDCIRLLPPVAASEVPAYVSGADLSAVLIDAVSKNNSLSLPNKFFESVAGGARVVATPLVELGKFIDKYHIGFCIESVDSEAFFHACRRAIAIPDEVYENGRKRLIAEHGWPIQRMKVQRLYCAAEKEKDTR